MTLTILPWRVVLALLLLSGSAAAQRGIDSELFRPALDSYGIFSVERAQTAPQFDIGLGVWFDYGHQPLHLDLLDPATSTTRRRTIMDRQMTIHISAYMGLTNWLQAAFEIPLSAVHFNAAYGSYGSAGDPLLQRTGFFAADRFTNIPAPNAAPLDPRVALKAKLFRQGFVGMALIAAVTLPFGDDAAFLGDRNFTFRPTLVFDITHKALTFAVNLGAIVRQTTTVRDPVQEGRGDANPRILLSVGHELAYSVGLAYRFWRYIGLGAELYGYEPLVVLKGAQSDRTIDVLGGFQVYPSKDVTFAIGGGGGILTHAERRDVFRAFAGLTWAPRGEERKGKGGGDTGRDSDGDGIPDGSDLCPNQPEDKDGFDDEDGCPDLDNDQDGIPDDKDKCPNQAEDRDGFEDQDGCPEFDNDQDGVPDTQDKCPLEKEDLDGFDDGDGCPEFDNDQDGIPDDKDKCPNEPETKNGVDDDDGCPDTAGQVQIIGGKLELPDSINFETGEAKVAGRSEALLNRVAEKIRPAQVKRIRIEGHTDNVGGQKRNQELSQARAEAVRVFLLSRGVEASRLDAVGFGDTRPLDRRNTASARAKNRRVEFIIVEQ